MSGPTPHEIEPQAPRRRGEALPIVGAGTEPSPAVGLPADGPLTDRHARRIKYLRVSVTDRCNFRCTYCMPEGGFDQLRRSELLSFDELTAVVRVMARLGVEKVRLTGGEPLLRRELPRLVGQVSAVPGIKLVAMTTNGHLLARDAAALYDAGLRRLNVSLDTFDAARFAEVTRGGQLAAVLDGLAAARAVGFTDLRINAVLMRGVNDVEVVAFVERCWREGWAPRFIELMPIGRLGMQHGDARLPATFAHAAIADRYDLRPAPAEAVPGPVQSWVVSAGPFAGSTVGFISPMSDHGFCATCNRARLTAQGGLRACLADDHEVSLRAALRSGQGPETIEALVRSAIAGKLVAHRLGTAAGAPVSVMTGIGG